MKKHLTLVIAVIGIAGKILAFPFDTHERLDKTWPVDSIRWMNENKELFEDTESQYFGSDKVRFFLYTHVNLLEPVEIIMDDPETLARSFYDFRKPTSFMIHGWKDQYKGGANVIMKNALFGKEQNRELNFIAVDWNVYSHYKNYTTSQQLCPKTGEIVAKFIDWMHVNAKLQFDILTLYGHSMGAQVAGFAGKNVKLGKVHSIIGMDPALPLFRYDDPSGRLADTDAEYVESIHTNGGYWGFYKPVGQTAFYPNGGIYQPGCGKDEDQLCSHIRAALYVAEALNASESNEFLSVRCSQFEHVKDGKCDGYGSLLRMGDPKNAQKPRGIYYLETNSEAPYAKGIEGAIKRSINKKPDP